MAHPKGIGTTSGSRLADPIVAEQVAALFANGANNTEVAEAMGVTQPTAANWRRDIRVRSRMARYAQDRIQAVTKLVDREIEARLRHAEELTLRELLDIRKEFLRPFMEDSNVQIDDETVNEAARALEADPDMVEGLKQLLSGNNVEKTPVDDQP